MTDKHVQSEAPHSNMEKDPSDWVTGDEAMTGAQKSYLKTLSEEAKVEFDESLSKAEASERIDELQHRTGRGAHGGHGHAVSAEARSDEAVAEPTSSRSTPAADGKGRSVHPAPSAGDDAGAEPELFETESGNGEAATR